ncbi:hypothetical protein DSCW_18210 [Desulfosarcina widdelii]|uniref:DUF4054 domain-containing protein n=1 Tax=Desulfosarcina widdelii TaxID=947919 RepID=A0A5K7Z7F1_9BACT|nr:DUF4054 domain-containing protein [Desulfosarcina widdelii]BBO74404.1 hypothetical protein DSCW_18210 [Desulfosarcina widdelii]
MSDTNAANVLAIAPELDGASQASWDLILADVATLITESAWGAKQEMAQRYLAAHKLSMIAKSESGPAVASEKTGDVSTTYAVPGSNADDLDETKYGREYKRLRRCTVAGIMTVRP